MVKSRNVTLFVCLSPFVFFGALIAWIYCDNCYAKWSMNRIKAGMTTAEAITMLGEPRSTYFDRRVGGVAEIYHFTSGLIFRAHANCEVKNGKIIRVNVYEDELL